MSNNVISDNWSLQDLSSLFEDGLNFEKTFYINVNRDKNKYTWNKIPRYFIQIKLLVNILNDIITRDNIIVDQEYIKAWNRSESLLKLDQNQIIKPMIYTKYNDEMINKKKVILEQICITDDMCRMQKECEKSWNLNKKYKKRDQKYFSQFRLSHNLKTTSIFY